MELSILITEDDQTTLNILANLIRKKFAVKVYPAEDGKMGLEVFKAHNPDIVITDINMPVMDGIEMAREIKLIKAGTRFIVLTGYSDRNYFDRFKEIGFKDFIMKPVDFSQLFPAIEKCLAEAALEHQC